eukprot:m.15469 g.15469  ORF g.15469 m.15469 type:complete len:346 (+) comp6633_c0_seq1:231-1268(+)
MSIEFSSWCTKQGSLRKNWKYRYLVLWSDGLLTYHTRQNDPTQASALRTIKLSEETHVIDYMFTDPDTEWPETSLPQTRFEIQVPDRTFHIYCDTSQERELWVEHLSRACGIAEPGAIASDFHDGTSTAPSFAPLPKPEPCEPKKRLPSATEQLQSDFRATLQAITQTGANSQCFDCQAEKPTWACGDIGIFLCPNCVAIHKKLQTPLVVRKPPAVVVHGMLYSLLLHGCACSLKLLGPSPNRIFIHPSCHQKGLTSITPQILLNATSFQPTNLFDDWSRSAIDRLKRGGNDAAAKVYEATLPETYSRPIKGADLESFIEYKYLHRKWYQEDLGQRSDATSSGSV